MDWVKAVGCRLFGRATRQARLCFVVDTLLLLGFGSIVASGLLISTWLNAPLGNAAIAWSGFHIAASQATLLLVLGKVAIHWRWIATTSRRLLARPAAPAVAKPVAAARRMGRRDFVKIMGVVSAAAALALLQTNNPAAVADARTSDEKSASLTQTAEGTQNAATTQGAVQTHGATPQSTPTLHAVSTATPCTARCPKGKHCSYPGSCRSYVDANRNGLCDLGECALG